MGWTIGVNQSAKYYNDDYSQKGIKYEAFIFLPGTIQRALHEISYNLYIPHLRNRHHENQSFLNLRVHSLNPGHEANLYNRLSRFISQLSHWLSLWIWISYLSLLNFSFPVCKKYHKTFLSWHISSLLLYSHHFLPGQASSSFLAAIPIPACSFFLPVCIYFILIPIVLPEIPYSNIQVQNF